MGRKRKAPDNIIQLDLGLVDVVSLDTKPFYVPQYIEPKKEKPGEPKKGKLGKSTYAEIISSRVWQRQPKPLDTPIPKRRGTIIYPPQPGTAWCGGECAAWKPIDAFSPRKRYRVDGTVYVTQQPWCRACYNRHARKMYWLQKEGYARAA